MLGAAVAGTLGVGSTYPGYAAPSVTPKPPKPLTAPVIPADQLVGGPKLGQSGLVVGAGATKAPPRMDSGSYVVADLETGKIIAAKAPHARMRPASTIKALLAVVLLPELDPQEMVRATNAHASAEGTRAGMLPGNDYSVHKLFQALIMSSGNDAAYALADAGGGRAKTVAAMNAKAAELGAFDTNVVDPSGLDAKGQSSSAYDLALIGRAAMDSKAYRAYATTKMARFPGGVNAQGKKVKSFMIGNHNKLLWNYDGTIGVKNGYTDLARQTFIGAVERNGRGVLIAHMGSNNSSWRPLAALANWGFANLDKAASVGTLVEPGSAERPTALGGPVAPVDVQITPQTTPRPTATPSTATSPSTPALVAAPASTPTSTSGLGASTYAVAAGAGVLLLLGFGQMRKARLRREAVARATARSTTGRRATG